MPTDAWAGNGGMDRICHYNFFDIFNARTRTGDKAIYALMKAQKILGIKRRFRQDFPNLYCGSSWWTLSHPCMKFVVDYTHSHPQFFNRFRYTFASTEMYFQTILMNSPFKHNVVNDNLRYIDWQHRNGSCPANLDETDFPGIIKSNAIFARKFHFPISEKLINQVETHIIKQST